MPPQSQSLQEPSVTAEQDGRARVVIEGVQPEIDAGRFPIKRTVGERVVVEADVFTDGHDAVSSVLLFRREADTQWTEAPMLPLVNDRWRGEFRVAALGRYCYTLQAWVDRFQTWSRDLAKRVDAGQDVTVDLAIGAALVDEASERATSEDAALLQAYARALRSTSVSPTPAPTVTAAADPAEAAASPGIPSPAVEYALSPGLAQLMTRWSERRFATTYPRALGVTVDRERARFSAWYELFPRSCAADDAAHGTFRDVEQRLRYVADMGFDVVYLPPIHPIGLDHRKGPNNNPVGAPGDLGSPWAIGAAEGGHDAILPALGTRDDFRRLVARARELGMEIALDLAFQCSPDHPYVRDHPQWFRQRPDGTVQYAENPPKKYQDIYPFDFETPDWRALWAELERVIRFWIAQGVEIFRVDNPHTKAFGFWETVIAAIKRDHPGAIFLAEAFTRPKVMYYLAKLGFTQSYTYFAWRNNRWELRTYFEELASPPVNEFFRPNLWPNTPDILTEHLQVGGRPAFLARLVLAATLGASYGIYGPAFELGEHRAVARGSEEYLDSEKYQVRRWDLDDPNSLREVIARVNRIRRENPALQTDRTLRFHAVDNEQLIAYSKLSDDGANVILTVVNLDPHFTQAGWVTLDLAAVGVEPDQAFQVHDLLAGGRYLWQGERNYVELNPHVSPAHIFRLRRRVKTERDFEYFL